jgi:hypothetical protein
MNVFVSQINWEHEGADIISIHKTAQTGEQACLTMAKRMEYVKDGYDPTNIEELNLSLRHMDLHFSVSEMEVEE